MEFLEQFFRCLHNIRNNEVQVDFAFAIGEQVLQTPFHALERSTAFVFTK